VPPPPPSPHTFVLACDWLTHALLHSFSCIWAQGSNGERHGSSSAGCETFRTLPCVVLMPSPHENTTSFQGRLRTNTKMAYGKRKP
jgi:hypothetical protein